MTGGMAFVYDADGLFAGELLAQWDVELPRFWQVVPKEMVSRLAHPLTEETIAQRA